MKEEVYQREYVALDSWLSDRADLTTIKLWEFSIQLVNFRTFSNFWTCYSGGAWVLLSEYGLLHCPDRKGSNPRVTFSLLLSPFFFFLLLLLSSSSLSPVFRGFPWFSRSILCFKSFWNRAVKLSLEKKSCLINWEQVGRSSGSSRKHCWNTTEISKPVTENYHAINITKGQINQVLLYCGFKQSLNQ